MDSQISINSTWHNVFISTRSTVRSWMEICCVEMFYVYSAVPIMRPSLWATQSSVSGETQIQQNESLSP